MLEREVRYFAFPFGHPENMSTEAMAIANTAYPHSFSAYGGFNEVPATALRPFRRVCWPPSLWELELALQGALERAPAAEAAASPAPAPASSLEASPTA